MSRTTAPGTCSAPLLALVLVAVVYIWMSSQRLPDLVASHFDAAGHANGYMSRGAYLGVLLVMVVLLPVFLVLIPGRVLANPNARINLPNRDYWLAPERRAETIRRLLNQSAVFASLVIVFLCYVQWLVVRAHAFSPPTLDSRALMAGLVAFLVCAAVWAVGLIWRLHRSP